MSTKMFTSSAPMTIDTQAAEMETRPTKLFIGGISRHTTTKHLRDHFSQIGRVLDCVAMRTQDGLPRGFGYVTLDSPLAAERCCIEPQVIDNRIVDIKLAVPEGSGASPANGNMKRPNFNMGIGMSLGQVDYNMAGHAYSDWSEASTPYSNGFGWWPEQRSQETSPTNAQGLDCLDLLCAPREMSHMPSSHEPTFHIGDAATRPLLHEYNEFSTVQDPLDGAGLLLPPILSSEPQAASHPANFQQWAGAPAQMSATAKEFVPLLAQSTQQKENDQSSTRNVKQSTATARKTGSSRRPLGELTNIVQAEDLLKPFASPSKRNPDVGQGHLGESSSPAAVEEETTGRSEGPLLSDESTPSIVDDASPLSELMKEEATAEASATAVKDVDVVESEQGSNSDADNEGSDESMDVDGEAVEVDLENLPSIGSAAHATGECRRCNFFAKGRCQNGKSCSFCHYPHEKRKLTRQEKRERRAEAVGQEACSMANSLFPDMIAVAAPPGLLSWQPDADASPFVPMGQTTLPPLFNQCAFQQIVTSSPLSLAPLATAGSGGIFSTVPSPAASAASTPLSTPTAGAAAMFSTAVGTSTFGTQTGSYMCRRCELDESKAKPSQEEVVTLSPKYDSPNLQGHLGYAYARDELLRLRDVLLKIPSADKKSSLSLRTAPIGDVKVM